MTPGQKISASRKSKGITQEELATSCGMSPTVLSFIENDKQVPDLTVLMRIAKALDDSSILSSHCAACPVRNEIFIRRFPELNNINNDPTVIVMKVKQELDEAKAALQPLVAKMLTKDFKKCPEYQATLEDALVQVMGTAQSLDILVHEFLVAGIMSPETVKESLRRLQEWCEHRGHHVPARTGTEG